MKKTRLLNIELARIFAMLLIFVWHINIHYIPEANLPMGQAVKTLNYICLFIPFHVDLFILISGFFGIHKRKTPFIKTLYLVLFYTLLLNIISFIDGGPFNWKEFLFPISQSPCWFMQVYLLLVLVSPIIEKYISLSSNKEFCVLLLIFLFLDVYLGFFWKHLSFYNHGYDLLNVITVYLLGVCFRKNIYITKYLTNVKLSLSLFVICCIIRYKLQPITLFSWSDYCSPITLLMALCIFGLFLNINISDKYSKPILWFASSAVSVYLITDYPPFRSMILPLFSKYFLYFEVNVWYLQLAYVFGFIIILFWVCCTVDKIRIAIQKRIIKN